MSLLLLLRSRGDGSVAPAVSTGRNPLVMVSGELEELDASLDYLLSATSKVRETGGPTILTVGVIADGQTVVRSGSLLIGITPTPATPIPSDVLASAWFHT